jgi:predicted ATPase/DNA-binding CsgD family transcriptional regulator
VIVVVSAAGGRARVVPAVRRKTAWPGHSAGRGRNAPSWAVGIVRQNGLRDPGLPGYTLAAACGYGNGVGWSAAVTAAGGLHGFPAKLTSFIGRDRPLAEVMEVLRGRRLVTVTGPGGAGKTRLAAEVARRVAGQFADGAWLAELAPVRDPAQVPAVVAAALGVRDLPGTSQIQALARALARQQLLLVLDNCEHVMGAAVELSAGLLLACDDVRVLATSREPLRIAGEARYRLGPLTLPDVNDPADAARAEAVALFVDRARRADARFTLDGQTGPPVVRIVTRLDGMPLAIELAAARVETLGMSQLLDRLDDRFALLANSDRLAAGRHRSLAAMAEWSYQLLDEHEQRVFRHLSVLPAMFTLDAAEEVAGQEATLAVLRLVECSLVVPPRPGPDGRSRYVMLETLRSYGAGLLAEAGEQSQAQAALARYAVRVAEEAGAELLTVTGEPAAARWLDAEDATMGTVLAWAVEHDPDTAARLVTALSLWWLLRGRLAGQEPLLRELAGRAEPGTDGWCAAQLWLGWTAHIAADLPQALQRRAAVIDVIGNRAPSKILADCLADQSVTLANLGRLPEATHCARRALAVSRELNYPLGQALAMNGLTIAASFAGDLHDAVQLARQAGRIPDIPGIAVRVCGHLLAALLTEAGDHEAAEQACATTLAQARDAGDLNTLDELLYVMADLDLRAGRTSDAAAHLREATQIALSTGTWFTILNVLYHCGYLCSSTGRFADAVTVWAAHDRLERQGGFASEDADIRREDALLTAQQELGPDQARVAGQRGAAMSLATAAEYALLLTAPSLPPAPGAREAAPLSGRERELITLVAQGRTDADIATQLYISISTVRSHLDRIRDKTGCRRRADLTRLALGGGLI